MLTAKEPGQHLTRGFPAVRPARPVAHKPDKTRCLREPLPRKLGRYAWGRASRIQVLRKEDVRQRL